ncbi:MAG: helix-turn-helix domain-containing protein [Clostridia bacterium]|nr:helix-turn-helix domain-containing protein [Clostridia bacterium]
MTNFSTRLKDLRTARDLKQAELAEHLSVDQRTISNWECGMNEPNFEMLKKIARFFDVSTDFLLGIVD